MVEKVTLYNVYNNVGRYRQDTISRAASLTPTCSSSDTIYSNKFASDLQPPTVARTFQTSKLTPSGWKEGQGSGRENVASEKNYTNYASLIPVG